MCYSNFCDAINYVSDLEANFNNYDDKINKATSSCYIIKKSQNTKVVL